MLIFTVVIFQRSLVATFGTGHELRLSYELSQLSMRLRWRYCVGEDPWQVDTLDIRWRKVYNTLFLAALIPLGSSIWPDGLAV